MITRIVCSLAALMVATAPLASQTTEKVVDPKDVHPLFRDNRTMDITILADFQQLFKDRDTLKEELIPARLIYNAPEGDHDTMAVNLATRGHSRLQKRVCDFPPIKVYFPEKDQRPPLFKGQGSLKLVVTCKPRRDDYSQYVLQEYIVYPIYNLFTDMSLRARRVNATYIQEDKGDTVAVSPAFWVEDADDMAKRNGGTRFRQAGVRYGDVEVQPMALLGVFNYMLGNTDWALQVLHNVIVVKIEPGFYHPVGYDFDFSGIIKTPYALPDQRLGLRSVRDRLYRGACYPMEAFTPIITMFHEKKDTIYNMYRNLEGLEEKKVKEALEYLDDFYDVINDPKKVDKEFRYNCS
jgi:hypothetical protein